MLNLFLDTNIYLNFYHFSDEDLDRLEDLRKLIEESGQIRLWVPKQVVDEFGRNRESKIRDALKQFQESTVTLRLPKMCAGYEDVETLRRLGREFADAKKSLLSRLNEDIRNQTLKADEIINGLISAHESPIENPVLQSAKERFDRGNPPGKDRSYGDAINWEFLLASLPNNDDLFFVTADSDFASPLDDKSFSLFLSKEWQDRKGSKVRYFTSLQSFFRDQFPDIELLDEYIKEQEIAALARARSFDASRAVIKRLLRIGDFSDSQIEAIVKASIENEQIYNANAYSPEIVGKSLEKIVSGHELNIHEELYREFCTKFELENVHDAIPF